MIIGKFTGRTMGSSHLSLARNGAVETKSVIGFAEHYGGTILLLTTGKGCHAGGTLMMAITYRVPVHWERTLL